MNEGYTSEFREKLVNFSESNGSNYKDLKILKQPIYKSLTNVLQGV